MINNAHRLVRAFLATTALATSLGASHAGTLADILKEIADAGVSLTKRIGPGPGADEGAEFAYTSTNGSDSGSAEFALSYAAKMFEDQTSVWEGSGFIAGSYTSGAKRDNNAFQVGIHAVGDLLWMNGTPEAIDDFGLFVRLGPTFEWSTDGDKQNLIFEARVAPFWPAIAANLPVVVVSDAVEFGWEPSLALQAGTNIEGQAFAVESHDTIFRIAPAAKVSLSLPGVKRFLGVASVVLSASHTHTFLPIEHRGDLGLTEFGIRVALTEAVAIGLSHSDGEKAPKFESEETTKLSLQIKIGAK